MVTISLVTGASSGLGRCIAKLLCEKGHKVYVTARRTSKLKELQNETKHCKGKILSIPGDLTNKAHRIKLINSILTKEKKLDYLINNAGYGTNTLLEEHDLKDIENMFQLNVIAYTHLIQLTLPSMKRKHRGKIINISSMVGFIGTPYFTIYASTKHAINGLTSGLYHELKGSGVTATAVCPARMKTGFAKVAFDCHKKKKLKDCIKMYNMAAQTPETVAKIIVRNLDTKKMFIYPTFRAKLYLFMARHLNWAVQLVIGTIVTKMMKQQVK